MPKEKISNKQAFLLSLNVILTTIILLVPSEMIMHSGREAWISIICASLVIMFIHYLVFKLSCQSSDQSLVQDCIDIFGKVLGRLILIPFIMLNVQLTILIIYESVGFVQFVMPNKGAMGIWIANALIGGYLSYKGIETIMRINGFGIFTMLFSIFIIVSTNYDVMDFARLQPIGVDFKQIVRGGLLPLHWFLIIPNLFLVYKPFFKDNTKILKVSLLGNLTSMIIILVLLVTTISIFGGQVGGALEYSFYTLSTLSITGLDVTVFVAWIMATMIKVGFYYFTSLYLIKEWFQLSSYKYLILPFIIFTVSLGYFQTDIHYLETLFIYIITIVIFVLEIPFLLLLIGAYAFKISKKSNS